MTHLAEMGADSVTPLGTMGELFSLIDYYSRPNFKVKQLDALVKGFMASHKEVLESAENGPYDSTLFGLEGFEVHHDHNEIDIPPSLNKTKGMLTYVNDNESFLTDSIVGENTSAKLIRIPTEYIESLGIENVRIFLNALQDTPNIHLELYSEDDQTLEARNLFEKYDIKEKELPQFFQRSRSNTITLFRAERDEQMPASKKNKKWERAQLGNTSITNNILLPVSYKYDRMGLIRSAILGIRLTEIARLTKGEDDSFVAYSMAQLSDLFFSQGLERAKFNFTKQDLVNLTTGDINSLVSSLNKLIKLIPVAPINVEELRDIHVEKIKDLLDKKSLEHSPFL